MRLVASPRSSVVAAPRPPPRRPSSALPALPLRPSPPPLRSRLAQAPPRAAQQWSGNSTSTSTLAVLEEAPPPSGDDDAQATSLADATMAPSTPDKYLHHDTEPSDPLPPPIRNALRGAQFFAGFAAIYGSYKAAQLRAAALTATGANEDDVKRRVWDAQHAWAGDRMHALCVSLRGFYLKAGQFIGARGDFVPEPVCRRLALLQDRVPPMPAAQAARVLRQELGVDDLSRVFEWIDLEQPLGSASVSQVHKARLRRLGAGEAARILQRAGVGGVVAAATAAAKTTTTYAEVTLAPGQTAWSVANEQGVGLAELAAANPGVKVESAGEGAVLRVPLLLGGGGGGGAAAAPPWAAEYLGLLEEQEETRRRSSSASVSSGFSPVFALAKAASKERRQQREAAAAADAASDAEDDNSNAPPPPASLVALARASALNALPPDRIVAVKVQYPSAEAQMAMDLRNIRGAAAFLRSTGEIPFDLVSAVDELRTQIAFEFDFTREARVMDTIALHLDGGGGGKGGSGGGGVAAVARAALAAPARLLREARGLVAGGAGGTTTPLSPSAPARVRVPRSIPGLVTRRVLAMEFIEGVPLLQLADRVQHLPQWQRERAARRVLERVSEAYGRMILGEGLFQADGHPGNIMVTPGGGVALLDYGQSKQLPKREQVAFARIVKALDDDDTPAIDRALDDLGVETERRDAALRREMAFGMFDTRGKVDPFDKNSPIKQCAITRFPPDLFFVLRVVQLLRGMANGMGIDDFSSAAQWAPLARRALRREERKRRRKDGSGAGRGWRSDPVMDITALAVPLQLNV